MTGLVPRIGCTADSMSILSQSDRHRLIDRERMCRTPEPVAAVARRLQAEKPRVPVRIMNEADVLDHEIELLPLPFRLPGEMRFLGLLAQPRDFDLIGCREDNLQ